MREPNLRLVEVSLRRREEQAISNESDALIIGLLVSTTSSKSESSSSSLETTIFSVMLSLALLVGLSYTSWTSEYTESESELLHREYILV